MFILVTISGCGYSIFNSGNAVMSVYVNQKIPPTYFSYNHCCSNLLSFFVQFRIDIQFINSKVNNDGEIHCWKNIYFKFHK